MSIMELGSLPTVDDPLYQAYDNYIEAGSRLDFPLTDQEVLMAMALTRRDDEQADHTVHGLQIVTNRIQVAAFEDDDISRGGTEMSDEADLKKITTKSILMYCKHLLYGTGNVGGKGGVLVNPEMAAYMQELGETDPQGLLAFRAELFAKYALAHNIHPLRNVIATDFGTNSLDMNAVIDALRPAHGSLAEAAASGATESHGGVPNFHDIRTGLGGQIVLDQVIQLTPELNSLREQRRLRSKSQGFGKAARPFVESIPRIGVDTYSVLEKNGALVSTNDEPLDPREVAKIMMDTDFFAPGTRTRKGLARISAEDFWSEVKADVAMAGAKEKAVTAGVAMMMAASGVSVFEALANDATTKEAERILAQERIESVPGQIANSGATKSSQLRHGELVEKHSSDDYNSSSDAEYERSQARAAEWEQTMQSVPRAIIRKNQRDREARGEFVTLTQTADEIVVQRAHNRFLKVASRTA